MALNLVAASSQYAEVDTSQITAAPFTACCWFNVNDVTVAYDLISIQDKDQSNRYWRLRVAGTIAGDPIWMSVRQFLTSVDVATSTGYTAGTWYHACMVEETSSRRFVFLNAGSEGGNTTNIVPAGIDRLSIGRFGGSSPLGYYDGLIAEVSIHNVVLSGAEIALLAAGVSALHIRPDALVNYYPLLRSINNIRDGDLLVEQNSPTYGETPPIIRVPQVMGFAPKFNPRKMDWEHQVEIDRKRKIESLAF